MRGVAFNCSIDFHYNLIKDFGDKQKQPVFLSFFTDHIFHTKNTNFVELLLGTVTFLKEVDTIYRSAF